MKRIFTILITLTISLSLYAQELSVVYVLSEGGFNAGTSMLSSLKAEDNTFVQSIFNPGNIGPYPDGLVEYNGSLYLTEQGSWGGAGKIYQLDMQGEVVNSAEVGTNPYAIAISNEKAYLTNGPASKVSVVNLTDLSLVKDVAVGVYPQEIIADGNNVFVANTSAWGGDSDSTVSVINAETDEVTNTIIVKKNPSALAISSDGFLLIGCPGDADNGVIYKVDMTTFEKVQSFTIPEYGFGKDIFVDTESDMIYF